MVRFLHTADWQLGKPYGRVKDQEKQARLKQLRFDVIERLAEVVQREKLEFVVVAGDLFDSIEPTRADVAQACSAIGAIGVPVLAIPGNHDHGGAGSFWHEAWFKNYKDDLAPNLQPLLERKPLHLPGALILPCPLNRQADTEDPLSWLKNYKFDQLDQRPRVVVAHGSVHGFGADELIDSDDENPLAATNRLNLAALPIESIDYIALGDWHGLKKWLQKPGIRVALNPIASLRVITTKVPRPLWCKLSGVSYPR
ncbi:DNA repair exonuclease [Synechococcus lacustris Tous-12m]